MSGAPQDKVRDATRRSLRVRPKRTQWVTWLAVAAIGGLITTAWFNRRDLDLVVRPLPADGGGGEPNAPTPKELASKLRENAFGACRANRWTECEGWLNEANGLDPDGENEKGVKETRKALMEANRGH